MPNLLFPTVENPAQEVMLFFHLSHWNSFFKECTSGTHLDALAAIGAALTFAPGLVKVGDDHAFDASSEQIPGVGTLNFIANTNTTATEDATVTIHDKPIMTGIHWQIRAEVFKPRMVHTKFCCQILQLAVTIHHADRTDVIALGEKEFHYHLPILNKPIAVGLHHHPFLHLRDARGQKLGTALDFHQAQPTPAQLTQTL
jgi:hypothetical protein